jgi:hypothetical protein
VKRGLTVYPLSQVTRLVIQGPQDLN